MKFFKGRKADLNLSINAIVILILAITMLGLGLGFMKNMFGKTAGQLSEVSEDIKAQMIEQLRTSGDKLTMTQEDIKMKKGQSKDIYFAVKNVGTTDVTAGYVIAATCQTGLEGGTTLAPPKTFAKTRAPHKVGEIDVQKMSISISSTQLATAYPCALTITDGTTEYAKKSFYITVEG